MQHVNSGRFRDFLLCAAFLLVTSRALADGGTLQAMRDEGGLRVAVFTSPATLTEGEVDISVLVQEAVSHRVVNDSRVEIQISPRAYPSLAEQHLAARDLATNVMLKSCHVRLAAGWHDLDVDVRDETRQARISLAVLVGPAPTQAASFWPWFTWPAIPIALVVANRGYQYFLTRRSATINRQATRLDYTAT